MNNTFLNLANLICLSGKRLSFAEQKGPSIVFTTSDLAKSVKALKVTNDKSLPVKTLLADSRRITEGSVFFAVKGFNCDGNQFVGDAIHRGAVAIVSENEAPKICPTTWIQVQNMAFAKAWAAKAFYENPDESLKIFAVTGTNGKTSVSWLIKHMLDRLGQKCGMIGTIQYDLGGRCIPAGRTTPDSLELYAMLYQMRHASCKSLAIEISSHSLEQSRVKGLSVDCACFTNLTQDHIDYHKTMDEYFKCKELLFKGSVCKTPKSAAINIDDGKGAYLAKNLDKSIRLITFAIDNKDAVIRAENLKMDSQSATFDLVYPEGTIKNLKISMPGHYNVLNVLTALSALYSQDIDIVKAAQTLADFRGVPGRMERVKSNAPFDIFIDYAHTDDALKNGLSMLKSVTKKRLLVVFGCGGKRDRTKRPKMVAAVQKYADFAWATSDNPRGEDISQIFADMKTGVADNSTIEFVENRRRAINMAISQAKEGDCILIAGKGHETFQELKDTIIPFDDKKVAEELLSLRELI